MLVLDGETAHEQMAIDEALARDAQPTLRLFRWKRPALSLGRNQIRPGWLDRSRALALGVDVVDRPTGGGLAVHGGDLSCSVVIPLEPGLRLSEVMAHICETLAKACRAVGAGVESVGELSAASRVVYCLAQRSSYALYAGGKKFGGLAIRRYPRALLVQGSCAVRPFPEPVRRLMSPEAAELYGTSSTWLEAACGHAIDEDELIVQVKRLWLGGAW